MNACAVALLLLVDVSGSVSPEHHALQREGIAAALSTQAIARVVARDAPIAVSLVEWDSTQAVVLPWRMLESEAALATAASDVRAAPRAGSFGATHLGDAVAFAVRHLADAPCAAERLVLDVSGDGPSNGGRPAAEARALAEAAGITINGLPIVTAAEPQLAAYFRDEVASADGFVIAADGFADVARAMRRKILFEVAQLEVVP